MPRRAIVFELTGEKILDAGDKVAAKHISQVQKIVKNKLESLENELKDQRARELEDLKMDVGRVKADAEMRDGIAALPVGGTNLRFIESIFPPAR